MYVGYTDITLGVGGSLCGHKLLQITVIHYLMRAGGEPDTGLLSCSAKNAALEQRKIVVNNLSSELGQLTNKESSDTIANGNQNQSCLSLRLPY